MNKGQSFLLGQYTKNRINPANVYGAGVYFSAGLIKEKSKTIRGNLVSIDGVAWTALPSIATQEQRNAAIFFNNTFITVGNKGAIYQSDILLPTGIKDSDNDGIPDDKDAFPNNPKEWLDTDKDGTGNNADLDDDNDGMPDTWEVKYGFNPLDSADAQQDSDGDGVANIDEYKQKTDPKVKNSTPDISISLLPITDELKEKTTHTLNLKLSNIGKKNVSSGLINLIISKDNVIGNADDQRLVQQPFQLISAQTSQTTSIKITLPVAGSYWLFAQVPTITGELKTDNNTSPLMKITVLPVKLKTQSVEISFCTSAKAGTTLTCQVKYTNSDKNNKLSGLALRLHYSRSQLTLERINSVLSTNLSTKNALPLPDTQNSDQDITTDQYLAFKWLDTVNAAWPGSSLPMTLVTLTFSINKNLNIGDTIPIGFSAIETATGYGFRGKKHTLTVENSCTLDIDNNGKTKALTDGLLVLRYLFGFKDATLINNALGEKAKRNTSIEIENYLSRCKNIFNIDGNTETKALTDGLLILRHLFGFSGETLINKAIGGGAKRKTSEAIESYLNDLQ